MSHDEKSTKPKYGAPVIVPLGEMAKGSGACQAGSGGSAGGTTCSAGNHPADYCTAGTSATNLAASYCTSSGFTAAAACTTSGFTATGGACKAGSAGSGCGNGASAA